MLGSVFAVLYALTSGVRLPIAATMATLRITPVMRDTTVPAAMTELDRTTPTSVSLIARAPDARPTTLGGADPAARPGRRAPRVRRRGGRAHRRRRLRRRRRAR